MVPESLGPIAPFFIVGALADSLAFYEGVLRFELRARAPEENPFFALVGRGSAQLCLKEIAPTVTPVPNRTQHEWASWDAFVHSADPDALAKEFAARGCPFLADLTDRDDGLRGFEVRDPDGYVLFFGRPLSF